MILYELNNKTYTKTELSKMSLKELSELTVDIQEEIHRLAAEKRQLLTLPKQKKNGRTLNKAVSIGKHIALLQTFANTVSHCKKCLRDSMQKERDFYKVFLQITKKKVNKRLFQKLICETEEQCKYTINYFEQ